MLFLCIMIVNFWLCGWKFHPIQGRLIRKMVFNGMILLPELLIWLFTSIDNNWLWLPFNRNKSRGPFIMAAWRRTYLRGLSMTCWEDYVRTGSQDFSFTWKEIVTLGKKEVNCKGGVWVKKMNSKFQSSRMHINNYCADLLERKLMLASYAMRSSGSSSGRLVY